MRLRASFGTSLPLRCIFLEPTIRGLAKYIRYDAKARAYYYHGEPELRTCLVPAQPRGTRPPLFLAAGYTSPDDTLGVLSRIIPHLGSDQPVFGLKPRWVDGHPIYSSVEEEAAEYLAEIRAVQPTGPYLLGGYCISGVVVVEMARQLLEEGEQIGLLALIDTERPTKMRTFAANTSAGWERAKHSLGVLLDLVRFNDYGKKQAASDILRHKIRNILPSKRELSPAQFFYHSKVKYKRTVREYTVNRYPGRITLIVNEEHYGFDKYRGWRGLPGSTLLVKKAPGDHITVFTKHGKELARLLVDSIDESIQEYHRGDQFSEASAT